MSHRTTASQSVAIPSLLAILIACLPLALSAQIYWAPSLDRALPYAQKSGKNVFMYVFTMDAQPCLRFQSETLNDSNVIRFLNDNFVSVAVNASSNRTIANHYGVFRVPTMLVLDSTGKEFSRFVTFYPSDKLIAALQEVDPNARSKTEGGVQSQAYQGALLQESFDNLFGWGNDGSQEGTFVQLSLVQGVVGSAFKVEYELNPGTWNYAQFYRELGAEEQFMLPPQYTIIFHLAGYGGHNRIDVKLIDADYDNFGIILRVPTDFKGHRLVIPSTEINYLWGEGNKRFDRLRELKLAITPDQGYWSQFGEEPKGIVYLDEFVILPGIRTDIPASDFTGRTN